ncbi:hypothetical protein EU805_01735 [Salipiger sp. IMCC34102]|uniref:hypothetical protein n=1 Tax=Salipiger sp. IMCC34102 TaxID=2510647 RepID=UPI00101DF82D|nr:hypothetical protein [Salipiger sp. IMCC34102]RYH04118.1 hypothetical protein EU805_01735 [Salipiger sp. IMCC34102]
MAKGTALRVASRKVRMVAHRTGSAADTIGELAPGVAVSGLTAGQFSAIDAMEHMVNCLGPADVSISAWTTGLYDVKRAAEMRANEQLRSLRFILDRGTFEKSPKFAGPLIQAVGLEAFRCVSVHAKVVIVEGARGRAVMRSSMNLNKNLRTEQFDIDVCDQFADFYLRWFDGLWEEAGRSQDNVAIMKAVYDRFVEEAPEPDPVDDPFSAGEAVPLRDPSRSGTRPAPGPVPPRDPSLDVDDDLAGLSLGGGFDA